MKANTLRWNTDERFRYYLCIKSDSRERDAAGVQQMTRFKSDEMKV